MATLTEWKPPPDSEHPEGKSEPCSSVSLAAGKGHGPTPTPVLSLEYVAPALAMGPRLGRRLRSEDPGRLMGVCCLSRPQGQAWQEEGSSLLCAQRGGSEKRWRQWRWEGQAGLLQSSEASLA